MNIAIVGCGYVGKAVAQYWQQNHNFTVTATTTTPEKISQLQPIAQNVVLVQGNDNQKLKDLLQNQHVVLLSVGAKSRESYAETYLETAKTLVSLLEQNHSVKQLIYTGSYSVYGDRNGELVNEDTEVVPETVSGKILSQTEQVLLSVANTNLRVCILRLGGIYGQNRELVKIFSRAFGTTRPGSGEDITNWIHLDDIVSAIEFARLQQLHGIYNLVDDAHLPSRELLANVCKKHNKLPVKWDASQTSNRPYNANVSNQKIKQAGYKLIHPQMIF